MRVISIPLTLGRADRVDPKFAPLGVLAEAQNLRVRKDGRLACRTGYQPLAMTTPAGALFAYDLHELNGRLIALGTSTSDGYPTDLWEYLGVTGQAGGVWRQGDPASPRTPIGPFTNMRQVAGIPHPEGGVSFIDGAAGGGYVCLSYRTASGTGCNTLIVRQSDDQTILHERAGNSGLTAFLSGRVVFAGGKFLLMGAASNNAISILQYTPGVSTGWTAFATVDGASANVVTAFDMVAVGNPTTAVVVVAFDRSGAVNLDIKAYSSAGAQVGSTISVAGTSTNQIALEADQTANQIVMLSRDTATLNLRTFNFTTGAVIAGPTATAAGGTGQLVRVRYTQTGTPAVAAVIFNNTNGSTIEQYNPATHALNYSQIVQNARLQTRVIDSSSPGSSTLDTVSFGALIGPVIASSSTEDATNALFTCSRSGGFQHVRRNYLNAKAIGTGFGLSLDTSVTPNKVLWVAGEDDGSELVMPSLALLDFKSTARRQTAKFGSLMYITGASPLVYDNRILVDPGFDLPGIISVTPSNGAGTLSTNGVYAYVVHFEFTLADGSIIVGPPSDEVRVTMGAADDTNTIVVQTPHCIPVSLGGAMYGADVTAVVSRTQYDATTGTAFADFRRAKTQPVATGAASYGATLSIVDTLSDAVLAEQGVIYTQANRGSLSGPLENNLPQSCSYSVATEDRIWNAGLFRSYEAQISKEILGGEVATFSEFSTFFNQVSAPILGLNFLDATKLIFTTDDIYAIDGEGPNDIGGGGFRAPREIPTPGGLKTWQSFLKVPEGLFFQIDDSKLFMLPRGADSPVWIGKDVEDTLTAYPDIVGACRNRKDNASCFASQNVAGTDGRIIVRDMRTGLWTTDIPALQASQGIEALVNYGATMAYLSGGVVYVQHATSFADEASNVIVTKVKTHPLYPFELGGAGTMHAVLLTGEFRSAGTLALRVSYDDGVNFITYDSFALSGLAVGQTVQRKWALQQMDMTSVVFEWTYTPSSPGEGFIAQSAGIQVDPQAGELRELDPSEMA